MPPTGVAMWQEERLDAFAKMQRVSGGEAARDDLMTLFLGQRPA